MGDCELSHRPVVSPQYIPLLLPRYKGREERGSEVEGEEILVCRKKGYLSTVLPTATS